MLTLTNYIFKGLLLTWLVFSEFLSSDWLLVFSKTPDQKQFCPQWISKYPANKLQKGAIKLLRTLVHIKIFKLVRDLFIGKYSLLTVFSK